MELESIMHCEPHGNHPYSETTLCYRCDHACYDHITKAEVCIVCPIGDKCVGFKP